MPCMPTNPAKDLTDNPTWDGDEPHSAHLVQLLRESSRQTSLPEASGGLPPVGPQAHQQLDLVTACRCRGDCCKQGCERCALQQTRGLRSRLKQYIHVTIKGSTCNSEPYRVCMLHYWQWHALELEVLRSGPTFSMPGLWPASSKPCLYWGTAALCRLLWAHAVQNWKYLLSPPPSLRRGLC